MDTDRPKKLEEVYKNGSREDLLTILAVAAAHDESIQPKKVTIQPAEMERIREILRVFGTYIENHYFFDILVSSKFGIVQIDMDGEYHFYEDADSLFLCLIDEIYNDVREEGIVREHTDIMILPQEEPELRCRVLPLIKQLQDTEHYRRMFEDYIKENRA